MFCKSTMRAVPRPVDGKCRCGSSNFTSTSCFLGVVLGVLSLAAFGLLMAVWLREARVREKTEQQRLAWVMKAMVLAFPLAYTAAYMSQTSFFKPNNFLPVVPFTGLALAWLLNGVWSWSGTRPRAQWGRSRSSIHVMQSSTRR